MLVSVDKNDALLVVDMQNDFLPGGALGIPLGDRILPGINQLMAFFQGRGGRIVLTQDWHPADHRSFASQHEGKKPFDAVAERTGIGPLLWPDHCVQGSDGAAFSPFLDQTSAHLVIRKGIHQAIDSYSTFIENDGETPTGLSGYLREVGVSRIFLCGLALDYCVFWSAMDGRKKGFEVIVVPELCRGIDEESTRQALQKMADGGVGLVRPDDLEKIGDGSR